MDLCLTFDASKGRGLPKPIQRAPFDVNVAYALDEREQDSTIGHVERERTPRPRHGGLVS